jgi:hypothetical protein
VEGERWGSSAAGCGIHQPRLELALPNAFISNKFVMILADQWSTKTLDHPAMWNALIPWHASTINNWGLLSQ